MEETEDRELSDLSDAQQIALAAAIFPSAFLSFFGSAVIIYCATNKRPIGNYEAILFGLSLCDLVTTFSWCIAPFLLPKDAAQERITSFGNQATCRLNGFFWQLSFANYFFNAFLCFYYVTTIVYGWTEDRFRRTAPYLHGLALGYPLVTACVGAGLGWFSANELGFGCWVNDYPQGCGNDPSEQECQSEEIAWAIGGLPIVGLFLFVLLCNIRIYCHVRSTTLTSMRRSLSTETQTKRLKLVASQCFLYVFAFWVTTASNVVIRNIESAGYDADKESNIYILLMSNSILAPSTGFWNMLIYIRPRYLRCREEAPLEPRSLSFRRSVLGSRLKSSTMPSASRPHTGKSSQQAVGNKPEVEQLSAIRLSADGSLTRPQAGVDESPAPVVPYRQDQCVAGPPHSVE